MITDPEEKPVSDRTMELVRLFLSVIVEHDYITDDVSDLVEDYIDGDLWVEFSTCSLAEILEEYEKKKLIPYNKYL